MEYLNQSSFIHQLNPLTKLLGLCCVFVLAMSVSNVISLLLLIFLIFILYLLSHAFSIFKVYFRLLFFAGIFMMILQLLFAHDGPELLRYVPRYIPILGWMGAINKDSLMLGLEMVARMAVFGLSLPLLLTTTQSRDLVLVMVERLYFPYQYAFMFVTSLRFVPTLFTEIENILQAQRARAFEMRSKNPVKQIRAYLPLITPLVMISLQKAERLAVAMETRGYGIGKRTYLHQPTFSFFDYICCFGCLMVVISIVSVRFFGIRI